MQIDLAEGRIWEPSRTKIEIVRSDDLVGSDGYFNEHKIVEIQPLNDELVAIKTISHGM